MLADLIIEARCTSTSNPSSVHRERERQFNSPPLDIPWFTRRRENIEEQRWKNITGAGSFRSTVSVDRQQPSSLPFPRYLRALEHRRPFSLSLSLFLSFHLRVPISIRITSRAIDRWAESILLAATVVNRGWKSRAQPEAFWL